MKIYLIVKYIDTEVINKDHGYEDVVTETEIICAYSSSQDAKIERSHLNRANKEDNVTYDIVETEVY